MATIKWGTPAAAETLMTTDLDALANSTGKISSVSFDNDQGYMYADFELFLGIQAARGVDARVDLYITVSLDGTNFGFGDDTIAPPSNMLVGSFVLKQADTAARYTHIQGVRLPNQDFKVYIRNVSGQAFAASGNTLKMRRYNVITA